jgi:hypothetical protein
LRTWQGTFGVSCKKVRINRLAERLLDSQGELCSMQSVRSAEETCTAAVNYIVTCLLKVITVEPAWTAFARERLCKHVAIV